jgi:RNase H-fold protein (predicted Holliday junction resolvase)
VERIATSSNNLKGTYVRRLRQASRKVRTIGAVLQQRTIVPVGYPANPDGKSKMEEELIRLRSRLRDLDNEVSTILETVGRLFDTAVEKRAEQETRPTSDERGTTVEAERVTKDMTPRVQTAIMGPLPPLTPHRQPGPSRIRGSSGAGGAGERDGGTGPRDPLKDPRDQRPLLVAGRSSRDGAAFWSSDPPGIRARRDTSRSKAVSSDDKTDFITVNRRRRRRRGGILPTSASLPASEDGRNSRARAVASHGVRPASRMKVREDTRGGATFAKKVRLQGGRERRQGPQRRGPTSRQPRSPQAAEGGTEVGGAENRKQGETQYR